MIAQFQKSSDEEAGEMIILASSIDTLMKVEFLPGNDSYGLH